MDLKNLYTLQTPVMVQGSYVEAPAWAKEKENDNLPSESSQSWPVEGNRGKLKLTHGSIIPVSPIHSSSEGRPKVFLFTP